MRGNNIEVIRGDCKLKKAFLSHSSKDQEVVDKLASKLGEKKVFYSKWDLDAGDLLPATLAEGLWDSDSKWFILIASKNSMDSKWVRYEINMAITRHIREENYRIVVAKIDDCDLHPELTPYLYVDQPNSPDLAVEEIVQLIETEGKGKIPSEEDWRKSIVDRYSVLESVEEVILQGSKILLIWGLYGIGKTTTAELIVNKGFTNKRIARFQLTKGHDLLRLSLELCSKAKMELPPPDATFEMLLDKSVLAIKELSRQDKIIFFDDVENATEENRFLKEFFNLLLKHTSNCENLPPIILASTFDPKLDFELSEYSASIKIEPLKDQYILAILKRWIKISNPESNLNDSKELDFITKELYGYPLAAKLAASAIVKYSLEQIMNDLRHFQSIRLDIAKQLIGRSRKKLTDLQLAILEILTIANNGLTQLDIFTIINSTNDINASKNNADNVREAIDDMFIDQLIYVESSKIQILPLMKDYFLVRINDSKSLKKLAKRIADYCKNKLPEYKIENENFVHYCSMASRLFMISGNEKEAQQLTYYFKGELKEAAERLYHAKEYDLSLKYLDMWLSVSPEDLAARGLKSRCLTRLERYDEAETEMCYLESKHYSPYKLYHGWGLLYRQKGDLSRALYYFNRGLDDRSNYTPLLRDKGDVLEQIGNIDGAFSTLETAYSITPRDKYIAPKYAALLEKKGYISKAIEIMEELVIAFPDEASFFHRLSMLYGSIGDTQSAYNYAKKAVDISRNLNEALTHLASMELRIGNVKEAEDILLLLPKKLPLQERRVRDTIYAQILINQNKFDEAKNMISSYDYTLDPVCADVLAKIEYEDALNLINHNQYEAAKGRIEKGIEIIEKTQVKHPSNQSLTHTLINLYKIYNSINSK